MVLQNLVVELAARQEIAVLLVTHDLDKTLYLSERMLILGGAPSRLQRELAVPRDRRSAELAPCAARLCNRQVFLRMVMNPRRPECSAILALIRSRSDQQAVDRRYCQRHVMKRSCHG
jgi:ABC-type nitrate/sulfonate/bicarbonate transport system ATPase subunit